MSCVNLNDALRFPKWTEDIGEQHLSPRVDFCIFSRAKCSKADYNLYSVLNGKIFLSNTSQQTTDFMREITGSTLLGFPPPWSQISVEVWHFCYCKYYKHLKITTINIIAPVRQWYLWTELSRMFWCAKMCIGHFDQTRAGMCALPEFS